METYTCLFFFLVSRPEKGITTYTLSPNRQRLFPNFWHTAIFNTFRRFRHQVLYVAPPFIVAYSLMNWATEEYAFFRFINERKDSQLTRN
jgi:UcrQ family